MSKAIKVTISIFGIIAVIIGAVLFKGYRDLEEVKKIASEFKPELIKVDAGTELNESQKKIEESCLKGEFSSSPIDENKEWICKCLGVNLDHYISPLLPKGEQGRMAGAKMFLNHSEEIGAKGMVLIQLCSAAAENLPKEMPRIEIEPVDRACVKDSDCQHIATQCSCSCGQGINKNQAEKYEHRLKDLCRHYNGKMCGMSCEGSVKCKDKLCTYVQSEADQKH